MDKKSSSHQSGAYKRVLHITVSVWSSRYLLVCLLERKCDENYDDFIWEIMWQNYYECEIWRMNVMRFIVRVR